MPVEAGVIDRIVEQNLGVYRASASRLQEDVSQEAQVASDYRGRLVYELLQNADDAMAGMSTASDRVSFLVTDEELWIANTGRALTEEDVHGLCGLGASSKIDAAGQRRASIGHKGLGFKSVLEITGEPSVYSRTVSFALGERHARMPIEDLWTSLKRPAPRAVPAMRFPVELTSAPERWSQYAAAGFNTAFCFPFRESLTPERRSDLADLLLKLPLTTVLFLKHLETVEVRVEQTERQAARTWSVSRDRRSATGQEWAETTGLLSSGLYRVSVTDGEHDATFVVAHDADVAIGDHRVGLSGPAWDGVELTEVSVATLEKAADSLPAEWRHFHVFLPTAEPCPYPILVNGAFSTDLSRQQVRVSSEPGDYNAHLVREAARLFRNAIVPLLLESGVEAVLSALDRGGSSTHDSAAADLLHSAICDELGSLPLLPTEDGRQVTLAEAVLPPSVLAEDGEAFRRVLKVEAEWNGQPFPAARLCAGRWAAIASDHGATELSPPEGLVALADSHDPERARTIDHESGGFELDPVLELCTNLWERTAGQDREDLETAARQQPLFPVRRHEDRSLDRVKIGDAPTFYPPRSARQDLPLKDLRFMCHPLCWGALTPTERQTFLDERMKAWSSLFDVREFRFETVVQAAVLPALVLNPDADALERRASLEDPQALAAICQLAGRFSKPDRPLRYQRLQSDRTLVNLARLPVPCRSADGQERWLPAYRVYFGDDWLGADSVEHIAQAVPEDSASQPTFDYLASPERFLGLLEDPQSAASQEQIDVADDEVDVDDDADQAFETNERERWIAFLSWIGVNRALRPVHFHDVDDDATGWLTTKNLTQPAGWAFGSLGETWESFAADIRGQLAKRADAGKVDPYLYEAHDLDQIVAIVNAAATDVTCGVARAFFEHLVRHWSWYAPFADCQVALVEQGKSPGQRAKPPRAMAEELVSAGDNLWLHRLRRRSICPTRLGPRKSEVTWRPSAELERRFGRRGRSSEQLLPVLQLSEGLSGQAVRAVAERLGVRAEPSPSTFGLTDARLLCEQLELLYGQPGQQIEPSDLREVIKPVYRQMFELLSGRSSGGEQSSLEGAPLLADTPDGPRFLPASEILYAATPGIRERSGVAGTVPTFVLEAEPAANAPLTTLFGVRRLEDALEWDPQPIESTLPEPQLEAMRAGLVTLTAPLLARIRAERTRPSDLTVLREFMERVEPVDGLTLTCVLDGEAIQGVAERPYFVLPGDDEKPLQAFVLWGDPVGWPPPREAAQGVAMALADALGINLVETFLAFIQSDEQQRLRLLDIAGAAGLLAEIKDELADLRRPLQPDDAPAPEPQPTPAVDEGADKEKAAQPTSRVPAAPPVPLLRFADLTIDGAPILVTGAAPTEPTTSGGNHGRNGQHHSPTRAAAGTDLAALDALGMNVAIAYEVRRLRREGYTDATDDLAAGSESIVVDVHSPGSIQVAEETSETAKRVLHELESKGISRLFPGFDILTIAAGKADRFIELKSSGVDAQVQAMSWNEWKTAGSSRTNFWLYLVGNLRADLTHAAPFVRAINDPFGTLAADETEDHQLRRAVQLRVREFKQAEHLELGVRREDSDVQGAPQ